MKHLLIMAFLSLLSHNCIAQVDCLGSTETEAREIEKNIGNTLLQSSITNYGQLMDVYAFKGQSSPQLVLYYDRNDTCRNYRIMMQRTDAPAFIENLKTYFKRIDDSNWLNNDNSLCVMMDIDAHTGIVDFDFQRVADLKKQK